MRYTTDTFIVRAKEAHGDYYDYSKVACNDSQTKVCIICPKHGEFWQIPHVHLKGCGCPKCSKWHSKGKEEMIAEAKRIHGDKYDYSQVDFERGNKKVCIICPEHGPFWQTLTKHTIRRQGCPKCAVIKRSQAQTMTVQDFIYRAEEIHGVGKYNYSDVHFTNLHQKISIHCIKHNYIFQQIAADHLDGHGCPKCAVTTSMAENEIVDFIQSLGIQDVELRNRQILNGRELDIYIPSHQIAIEFDSLIWHSDKFQTDRNYHLDKTELCKNKNIRLIHIFEDEYLQSPDIVRAKIKHLLHCAGDLEKVYARRCVINSITKTVAETFLNENHIQGFNGAGVYLGALYKKELVGVMTFKCLEKGKTWELTRFATDLNRHCIGLGGKLFKYFTHHYKFETIKSFADRRWTPFATDNLYTCLGFILDKVTPPDYSYVPDNGKVRYHKFGFRKKTLLAKYPGNNLNPNMTEMEMTKQLGFHKIWNCGLLRYVYYKKETDSN